MRSASDHLDTRFIRNVSHATLEIPCEADLQLPFAVAEARGATMRG